MKKDIYWMTSIYKCIKLLNELTWSLIIEHYLSYLCCDYLYISYMSFWWFRLINMLQNASRNYVHVDSHELSFIYCESCNYILSFWYICTRANNLLRKEEKRQNILAPPLLWFWSGCWKNEFILSKIFCLHFNNYFNLFDSP